MNAYCVEYKMHIADDVQQVCFLAKNKEDAYEQAVFDIIPKICGSLPYSAWVHSVTYNNGNYRVFNTFEGKPC